MARSVAQFRRRKWVEILSVMTRKQNFVSAERFRDFTTAALELIARQAEWKMLMNSAN